MQESEPSDTLEHVAKTEDELMERLRIYTAIIRG